MRNLDNWEMKSSSPPVTDYTKFTESGCFFFSFWQTSSDAPFLLFSYMYYLRRKRRRKKKERLGKKGMQTQKGEREREGNNCAYSSFFHLLILSQCCRIICLPLPSTVGPPLSSSLRWQSHLLLIHWSGEEDGNIAGKERIGLLSPLPSMVSFLPRASPSVGLLSLGIRHGSRTFRYVYST